MKNVLTSIYEYCKKNKIKLWYWTKHIKVIVLNLHRI
jgi:hypothetical protein